MKAIDHAIPPVTERRVKKYLDRDRFETSVVLDGFGLQRRDGYKEKVLADSVTKLDHHVKVNAPDCLDCDRRRLNVSKDRSDFNTDTTVYRLVAHCAHVICTQERKMASNNDIFTPGWTTSKPGDMKAAPDLRQLGEPSRKVPKAPLLAPYGELPNIGSPEQFQSEYQVSFEPAVDRVDMRKNDRPETQVDAW